MLNWIRRRSLGSEYPRSDRCFFPSGSCLALTAALAILILVLQSACILPWRNKKPKAAPAPPPVVQVAFLPFNVAAADNELRWVAMATPVMLAKVSERAREIEVIPLWQAMPIALDAAGASRTLTADSGAQIASYLSAKWATIGEFTRTRYGVSMIGDFIPAQRTQVPFRFIKRGSMETVGSNLPVAISQFLRYVAARPLLPEVHKTPDLLSLRTLAEALDREYGWFVEAQPGKADEIVSELANSDERLARLLFSPTLYPALAQPKKN
jgi:hypothetical protein